MRSFIVPAAGNEIEPEFYMFRHPRGGATHFPAGNSWDRCGYTAKFETSGMMSTQLNVEIHLMTPRTALVDTLFNHFSACPRAREETRSVSQAEFRIYVTTFKTSSGMQWRHAQSPDQRICWRKLLADAWMQPAQGPPRMALAVFDRLASARERIPSKPQIGDNVSSRRFLSLSDHTHT